MTAGFLANRSKGQVFVIIGVVIALSLLLIKIKTNFDVALRRKELYLETNEDEIFRNIEGEFRETYDIAVKRGGGHEQLNKTLRNFTLFLKDGLKTGSFKSLYSFATYDNSSLNVSVWNFLGRKIRGVNVSQNLTSSNFTCGNIPSGQNCYNKTDAPGESKLYHINLTYIDPKYGKKLTKTYEGWTGQRGNYTAIFYRLEVKIRGTELTDEDTAWSKPV